MASGHYATTDLWTKDRTSVTANLDPQTCSSLLYYCATVPRNPRAVRSRLDRVCCVKPIRSQLNDRRYRQTPCAFRSCCKGRVLRTGRQSAITLKAFLLTIRAIEIGTPEPVPPEGASSSAFSFQGGDKENLITPHMARGRTQFTTPERNMW